MTTYTTKLTARVVFDNGIERFFTTTNTAELDDEDKITCRDLVTHMRELVRRAYRENSYGSITVGDMTINLHKTSAVLVTLHIYDVDGKLVETI